jgi:hypothetical protein
VAQPIEAEGTRAVHGSLDIPQARDMVWEPVQHFTGVFLAVRPHSISQKCLHLSLSSSLRNFVRADR